MAFFDALALGRTSTAEALTIFDGFDPVETDFLLGSWQGMGFPTGHPLDGLLEAYHWHGKRFDSTERVHPLVFVSGDGRKLSVDPVWMLPFVGLLRGNGTLHSKRAGRLFRPLIPFVATQHARARLRMTRYRAVDSATMIYDNLPINDVFRKVTDETVLGIMDLKGLQRPFFFVLWREQSDSSNSEAT